MVVATNNLADAHVDVVDDHREVVGGEAIGTKEHQVIKLLIAPFDAALDHIIEHHAAVAGIRNE